MTPLELVLERLEGVRRVGAGYVARCPAHPDKTPSLGIDEGEDGRVLLVCRAGCDTADVLAAMKLEPADLFVRRNGNTGGGGGDGFQIIDTYPYHGKDGELLFEVVRYSTNAKAKGFYQRRPDGRGGWIKGRGDAPRVLYQLPRVAEAVAQGWRVWVVEGEKDALALGRAGEVATTCPEGAGKWRPEYAECLRGADVLIVPDQDPPGTKHAADVEASLVGVAASVTVVRPAVGKDAADHLGAGKTVEEFVVVDGADPGGEERRDGGGESGLEFVTMRALAAEVDGAAPVGYLLRPVWPADAYGVLAAEHKAGKTWFGLDMAVAVASGTPWLGVYPVERQGPVLLFLGEGGKRKMLRRLRAICASRGLRLEDLPIEVCFRAPHLTSEEHLARIATKVAELRPVLVLIDPLYLAARGAKAASLYDMGAHLENVQAVVQAHDAALCVIHHWNQTGTGKGAERMSGAGPAEWGRVLISARVEHRHTDEVTMATTVTLELAFLGDEIPDTELRIRRKVWADNPEDLTSAMHYEVERLEAKAGGPGSMRPATARVLAVLEASPVALSVREIGDTVKDDSTGIPLRARTIQDSLKHLEEANRAECEHLGARAYVWRALGSGSEGENAF